MLTCTISYRHVRKAATFFVLTTLIILVESTNAVGQKIGMITGQVKDRSGSLEFVAVSLYKTQDTNFVISSTFTDVSGQFVLDNIHDGRYKIRYELIGYSAIYADISITNSEQLNVGRISLNEVSTVLGDVTIIGAKKLIEKTSTGFILNAGSNITQPGGTASDILKSTPTINVDADGNITLRGKTPMFMINGRNTTISNLDQIAASNIESIEVINNADSKFDANAESGIINIRLKKNRQNGRNGNFSFGAGGGVKGRISSSVLLNHKTEKWNFGIGYDNRFANRDRNIDASRTTFDIPDLYNLSQNRHDDRLEQLQNLGLTIDFAPDSIHSLMLEIAGNKEGQDNLEDLNSLIRRADNGFVSNENRYSAEYERSKVAEIAITFGRKFRDNRKSFGAMFSTAFNDDREDTTIDTKDFDQLMAQIRSYTERTHNYENENLSILKLDYEVPALFYGRFDVGYKGVSRMIRADYETADKIGSEFVVNFDASNIFTFGELVNAAYFQYNSNVQAEATSKWRHSLGLRAEQTNNHGNTEGNDVKFSNNYINFFPSAAVAYNTNQTTFWKINYAKRINRPAVDQFNPFIDITDALNPHGGNPGLKPELVENMELGYNKEWTQFSITSNAFFRHATNTIRQFQELQPDGIILRKPVNIGTSTTYGFESIFTGKLSKVYDLNASISLFETRVDGSNLGAEFVNNVTSWYGKIINNIVPWQNAKIQIIGSYSAPTATPQGRSAAQQFVDVGFQQKLSKSGNARLGLTVVDVFNTLQSGYINNTPQFVNYRYSKADTRAIMLVFGYSFRSAFKEKMLDNTFSKE